MIHTHAASPRAYPAMVSVQEDNVSGATVGGSCPASTAATSNVGNVPPSSSVDKTFTIQNIGGANLNFLSVPPVSLQALDAMVGAWSIITLPSVSSIPPASSTFFVVRFTPAVLGPHRVQVFIETNAGNWCIELNGMGAAVPDMKIARNGNSIVHEACPGSDPTSLDPATTFFGDLITSDAPVAGTVTITNAGAAPLEVTSAVTIEDVASTPGGAGGFSVTQQPTFFPIAPSGSSFFVVRFDPAGRIGMQKARIRLETNLPGDSSRCFVVGAMVIADCTASVPLELTFTPSAPAHPPFTVSTSMCCLGSQCCIADDATLPVEAIPLSYTSLVAGFSTALPSGAAAMASEGTCGSESHSVLIDTDTNSISFGGSLEWTAGLERIAAQDANTIALTDGTKKRASGTGTGSWSLAMSTFPSE
jgi:hypothetical protein